MWFFKKREFKLPPPLEYRISDAKHDLHKYSIQVVYKDKKIDKFELFDTEQDITQSLDLTPNDYRTLVKSYLSDEIKNEAKSLYLLEFKSKSIVWNNQVGFFYNFITNTSTNIPIKGDVNNLRIVRSEDIKEILIKTSVYKTIEYKWAVVTG